MKKVLCILFLVGTSLAVAQSPVPAGAELDTVAHGFQQAEGPVWKDGTGLLFSDIARSRIYLWSPATGDTTTYLHPSDSSNGLTFDLQGRLVLTQMQQRRVSRQETDGSITVLAATYQGKRFSSPNDLVVKSDGSVFFTDPNFNIPRGQQQEIRFMGIYRISPSGSLQLLDSTVTLPNGICFSPDEKLLYVNASQQGDIYVWDVVDDTTISGKRLLWHCPNGGYLDGMKIDPVGNIYCAGPTGIWIISPSGTLLDRILTPQSPSNCAWGDADKKGLYITSNNFVYRIRLSTSLGIEQHGSAIPSTYELKANYPNPFNPSTVIEYGIPKAGHVAIAVYDTNGRMMETLVDQYQNPGVYRTAWNIQGKGTSSGTYFVRMQIGGIVKTQKLVLLK